MSKYSSDSSGTTNERMVSNKNHVRKSENTAKHRYITQERTENLATHHRQPFQMPDRLTTTTGAKSRRFNEESPSHGTPVTRSNTSQVTFYYNHLLF